MIVSQVEAEKPNPTIFLKACELLGVNPEDAVHVGDDRRNDVWGARDAGCDAWLWGSEVTSFKEVNENLSAFLKISQELRKSLVTYYECVFYFLFCRLLNG